MIKTMYAVSRMNEWKDISIRLRQDYNIEPVYWICSAKFENEIKEQYPSIIYHETLLANKGIPVKPYENISYNLDKETISLYSNIEREFYIMLNRHDFDGSFSFEERRRIYYRQLKYWLYIIEKIQFDMLILSETPHSLSHYIIYSICKKKNIKTLMLSFTTIPGILYIKNNFQDTPQYSIEGNKHNVKMLVEAIVEQMTGENNKLWYMVGQEKRLRQQNSPKMKLKLIFNFIMYLLEKIYIIKRKSYKDFYKKEFFTFEESFYTKAEYVIQMQRNRKKQKKMQSVYRSLCEEASLKEKYLYYPLHYQPERSSCPEGSVYTDQILVIELISGLLPDGWLLYIKEHPSQFMMNRGVLGRDERFYKDVNSFNNVVFIKDSYSSMSLIDNSKAVITLTGTAGFESILRGTPSFVFGYAWYRDLPGVFYLQNKEDVEKALLEIEKGYKHNIQKVKEELEIFYKYFFTGYLAQYNKKAIDISYEDHVDELYNGYTALLDNMGYRRNKNE